MVATRDWEDPYYPLELTRRKVMIDVTRSAPNFETPIDCLSDVAAELRDRGLHTILDFGAGKLRNAIYLLRHSAGFRVRAVEFKECYETPFAKKQLETAQQFHDFSLDHPKQFLQSQDTFDAVVLINVANVIPLPQQRVRVLLECTKRLRKGGLLLWMSQHGEPNYRPGVTKRLSLEDGWCYNLDKKFQTFYREYKLDEIRDAVLAHGYKELRKVSSKHNRGFLFERQ